MDQSELNAQAEAVRLALPAWLRDEAKAWVRAEWLPEADIVAFTVTVGVQARIPVPNEAREYIDPEDVAAVTSLSITREWMRVAVAAGVEAANTQGACPECRSPDLPRHQIGCSVAARAATERRERNAED